MSAKTGTSFMARLYESQASLAHPLTWPKAIHTAPAAAVLDVEAQVAVREAEHDKVQLGLGHKMLAGAVAWAHKPLALAACAPPAVTLLGGLAPAVVLGGASALALGVGTGGLSHARSLQAWFAGPNDKPGAWHRALAHVCGFGLFGCMTELMGASIGRFGANLAAKADAGVARKTVGFVFECIGYGTALLTGAVLTMLRLPVAALFAAAHTIVLLFAAAAGAGWACAAHVLALGRAPKGSLPGAQKPRVEAAYTSAPAVRIPEMTPSAAVPAVS